MEEIAIRFDGVGYPYFLGHQCTDALVARLLDLDTDAYFVVTDATVDRLYGTKLCVTLSAQRPTHVLECPAGEQAKNLDTLGSLAEQALSQGMTRRSCVVAFGGGLIGNVAGLMAALCFRGVRLVHVPTTVVAMFDGVLSLKQALNTSLGKNLIGTFHRPEMVLADTAYLLTLPERERRSGLCELIKNALAIAPETIPALREILTPDCAPSRQQYARLAQLAIAAKLRVLAEDQRERRAGMVLEYGHTVGHAVEFCSGGALSHGESVGIGMICAAELAHRLGLLDRPAVDVHQQLLAQCGARTEIPRTLAPSFVVARVRYDNKRGYRRQERNTIDMVLLSALGHVIEHDGLPLTRVPIGLVEAVVRSRSRG